MEHTGFVTTGEVARRCGVQINTVKNWIQSGLLPAVRTPGGHWRIAADDFARFLQRQGYVPEAAKAPVGQTHKTEGADERCRILIVDDDPETREFVSGALDLLDLPHEVRQAADGYEGLIEIGRFSPHLLLLDIMMPEINGLEVISRLRQRGGPERDMAIVVLTGVSDRPLVLRRLRDAAPDAILAKPVSASVLIDVCRELLLSRCPIPECRHG